MYPHLASLAAAHELPQAKRQGIFKAFHLFVETAAGFLKHEKVGEWLQAQSFDASRLTRLSLRFLVLILSCGTVNWLRHERNEWVCGWIRKIGFEQRLRLMNGGKMQCSPDSLPKKLQWLVAGPPQDKSMTTAYGADRKFDRTTPWLLGLDHLQVCKSLMHVAGE